MIYILVDFICLDISILKVFLIFCLSDFIDNCKSPVDIISDTLRVGFGHHMRVGFCLWAIELTRVVRKISHFGIGII